MDDDTEEKKIPFAYNAMYTFPSHPFSCCLIAPLIYMRFSIGNAYTYVEWDCSGFECFFNERNLFFSYLNSLSEY